MIKSSKAKSGCDWGVGLKKRHVRELLYFPKTFFKADMKDI